MYSQQQMSSSCVEAVKERPVFHSQWCCTFLSFEIVNYLYLFTDLFQGSVVSQEVHDEDANRKSVVLYEDIDIYEPASQNAGVNGNNGGANVVSSQEIDRLKPVACQIKCRLLNLLSA